MPAAEFISPDRARSLPGPVARSGAPEAGSPTGAPSPQPAPAPRPPELKPVEQAKPDKSLATPDNRRRRTIFGRTDRDVVAMMYAEGWRQKVELNAAFDTLKAAKVAPYTNPVVTVALRSDGSVDSIVINQSSGVAEVDAAVRKIIQVLAPYAPFPRDLAAEYDVIEIRRIWSFDTAVRLFGTGR